MLIRGWTDTRQAVQPGLDRLRLRARRQAEADGQPGEAAAGVMIVNGP